MEGNQPGAPATPPVAEPAAPAPAPAAPAPQEPAQPGTPPASEGVKPPEGQPGEQHVPYQRFQEVNDAKKAAEDKAAALEAELEEARKSATPQISDDEDELDPEVEDLVRKAAKKLGLVSQSELQQQQLQEQVKQDVKNLEAEYANSGVPYNHQEVINYAKENNLPITSKSALRAAYRDMNWDKLVEAERQKSVDAYKSAGSSGAERPGNSAPPTPKDESGATGGLKGRIGAAIAKTRE